MLHTKECERSEYLQILGNERINRPSLALLGNLSHPGRTLNGNVPSRSQNVSDLFPAKWSPIKINRAIRLLITTIIRVVYFTIEGDHF